jgi:hypothetical protein
MLLEVKLVRLRQGFTIDATHNAAIVSLVIALVKAPMIVPRLRTASAIAA